MTFLHCDLSVKSVFGGAQKHVELLEVVTVAELCQEGTLRDHIDILYNVGSRPVSGAPSCEGQELSSPDCSECAFSAADQVRAPMHQIFEYELPANFQDLHGNWEACIYGGPVVQ